MPPRVVPPRLHAILARESDRAIVVARVRATLTCTVGWDRRRDAFEVGQWVKARVYVGRSDLSPDGVHFVYFAFDGRRVARGESEAYTAVSRTPHLKAVAFWPFDDTWYGGGLFLDDRTLWARGAEGRSPTSRFRVVATAPGATSPTTEDRGVYYPRLRRDGWTKTGQTTIGTKGHHDVGVFEKPAGHGLVLVKHHHGTAGPRREGRGCYYEEHTLVARDGTRTERPDWEWADVDAPRRRVVYASGGRLWAAPVTRSGLGDARCLFDATTLQYASLEAPY